MSPKILIDTCGWIDFLRSKNSALGDRVEQALVDDTAALCGVVQAELLQGAKTDKEKQQLEFLFANVECLPMLDADWQLAGHLLQSLRSTGITLPVTDALIATVAKRHGVAVLTVDAHFKHLSEHCSVGLVEVPIH